MTIKQQKIARRARLDSGLKFAERNNTDLLMFIQEENQDKKQVNFEEDKEQLKLNDESEDSASQTDQTSYNDDDESNRSFRNKLKPSKAVAEFIQASLEKGMQPLPILNRITDEGALTLINYKLNGPNAQSFAEALKMLVPKNLVKLLLMDNLLSDNDIALVFESLGTNQKGSLNTLCIL